MSESLKNHIIFALCKKHFTPEWLTEYEDTYSYGILLAEEKKTKGIIDQEYMTMEQANDPFAIPKLFFWTAWKRIKTDLDSHNVQLNEQDIVPILEKLVPHQDVWAVDVRTDYDFVMCNRAARFEQELSLIPVSPELPPPPEDENVIELTMSMCIDLPQGSVRNKKIVLWKKEFPNDSKGILLAVKYLMDKEVDHPGVYYELLKSFLNQVHEQYKKLGLMHLNQLQILANQMKKKFQAMADKSDRSDSTVKKELSAIAFGLLHCKLAEVNM